MRINFLSAVQTTMAALPGMVERRRGSVVSITSVAGYIPNPNESAYGASKAALHLWSHGLGVDLHGTGVHVGVLSPGPIDTPIWALDETPSSYTGKKYAPEVVAIGVVKMIEGETAHATVPRRFGAVGPMYALPLVGRAVRRGLIAFDQRGKAG
jgi:short-subunit dehydrogenase